MVHSPALSPDCNKRGSPLTRTQPSRRSIFNSISACQRAWGAGQRMEEGEAASSQVGKVAAKGVVTRRRQLIQPSAGHAQLFEVAQDFRAPGVACESGEGESVRACEPKSTRQPLRPNSTAVKAGALVIAISA